MFRICAIGRPGNVSSALRLMCLLLRPEKQVDIHECETVLTCLEGSEIGVPGFGILFGDMTQAELRRLARIGAEARLEALQREIAAIYQVFPELRRGRLAAAPNPYAAGVRAAVAGAVTRRRRTRLSPQARKRIAEAQKKRWAEWKAKNSKAAEERPAGTSNPKPAAKSRKKK